MNIKVRKTTEEKVQVVNPSNGRVYMKSILHENGFVEEMEIDLKQISAFSLEKKVRLIGVDAKTYFLTLNSWKEVKKELTNKGMISRFDLRKKK